MVKSSQPPFRWDRSYFDTPAAVPPHPQNTFASRQQGYNVLGVRMYVASHAARVHKTLPTHSFLFCQLPNCAWKAMLASAARDGTKWQLMTSSNPDDNQHDEECADLVAGRPFKSLAHRRKLVDSFTQSAVAARPRQALRRLNLDHRLCPPDENQATNTLIHTNLKRCMWKLSSLYLYVVQIFD